MKLTKKILESMNDKGMIAPLLATSLLNPLKPENKGQLKFIKDQNSIRVKDFLIKTIIPVTLIAII